MLGNILDLVLTQVVLRWVVPEQMQYAGTVYYGIYYAQFYAQFTQMLAAYALAAPSSEEVLANSPASFEGALAGSGSLEVPKGNTATTGLVEPLCSGAICTQSIYALAPDTPYKVSSTLQAQQSAFWTSTSERYASVSFCNQSAFTGNALERLTRSDRLASTAALLPQLVKSIVMPLSGLACHVHSWLEPSHALPASSGCKHSKVFPALNEVTCHASLSEFASRGKQ